MQWLLSSVVLDMGFDMKRENNGMSFPSFPHDFNCKKKVGCILTCDYFIKFSYFCKGNIVICCKPVGDSCKNVLFVFNKFLVHPSKIIIVFE